MIAALFDLLADFGFLALAVVIVVSLVQKWQERRDTPVPEERPFRTQEPQVRISYGIGGRSWRDELRLPAPMNGTVSLIVPATLPLHDVTEYAALLRPMLSNGYRVALHRGHSPFIGEVGLAAQRFGAQVKPFRDQAGEVEGMVLVPAGRLRWTNP